MANYTYTDDLSPIFVGRRIVKAEFPAKAPSAPADGHRWYDRPLYGTTEPVGLLTLDDGTRVYVAGNDGGCACSAGCYYLKHVATVDNIITSVKVVDDRIDWDSDDWDRDDRYQIFVVTGADEINVAEFSGDDGNGYYGSGFHLYVVPAGEI